MPRTTAAKPAELVDLSPSQQAILYGPGRVRLVESMRAWALSDREAPTLIAAWLVFEERRRPGVLDEIVAQVRARLEPGG